MLEEFGVSMLALQADFGFWIIDGFLGFYGGLNDFVFNTGIFGFSFGDMITLVPESIQPTIYFYMERLGFVTVINLYTVFFSIKMVLRLIPFVGKLF